MKITPIQTDKQAGRCDRFLICAVDGQFEGDNGTDTMPFALADFGRLSLGTSESVWELVRIWPKQGMPDNCTCDLDDLSPICTKYKGVSGSGEHCDECEHDEGCHVPVVPGKPVTP